jgi:hypothetical protein
MAGARGRSGGARAGAGRPKGDRKGRLRGPHNLSTIEERNLYARCIARVARSLQNAGTWAGPKLPTNDAIASVMFTTRMLITLAAKGDARAAIHLDERLHGRVKFQYEHGGMLDAPPIQTEVRGDTRVVYTCEFENGADVPIPRRGGDQP